MKRLFMLGLGMLLAAGLVLLPSPREASAEAGWTTLFDGANLDNWT